MEIGDHPGCCEKGNQVICFDGEGAARGWFIAVAGDAVPARVFYCPWCAKWLAGLLVEAEMNDAIIAAELRRRHDDLTKAILLLQKAEVVTPEAMKLYINI